MENVWIYIFFTENDKIAPAVSEIKIQTNIHLFWSQEEISLHLRNSTALFVRIT